MKNLNSNEQKLLTLRKRELELQQKLKVIKIRKASLESELIIIKSERRSLIKKKKLSSLSIKKVNSIPQKRLSSKLSFRIRKQVVINFVNRLSDDTGLIFLSIRAITTNPDINEQGLRIVVNEQKNNFEFQTGISLSEYKSYYGFENINISNSEDSRLNDGNVWIEYFYNARVMKTFKYQ